MGKGIRLSIEREKERLRAEMRRWRRGLAPEARLRAGRLLSDRFVEAADALKIMPLEGQTFAAYWPIGSELDTRELLFRLERSQAVCALPVVSGPRRPLSFRQWSSGTVLVPGPSGTWQPKEGAAEVDPDILLVPMLAFDRRGYRVGQGGGYYDRTLRRLRERRVVIAVGLAYAGQEVPDVPHGGGDERLDWVVTDESATKMEKT